MGMTKKDFEVVAESLRITRLDYSNSNYERRSPPTPLSMQWRGTWSVNYA